MSGFSHFYFELGSLWTMGVVSQANEKVSTISEIPAHHRDLVFQSNEGMTPVLIKPSQLRGLKFLRN